MRSYNRTHSNLSCVADYWGRSERCRCPHRRRGSVFIPCPGRSEGPDEGAAELAVTAAELAVTAAELAAERAAERAVAAAELADAAAELADTAAELAVGRLQHFGDIGRWGGLGVPHFRYFDKVGGWHEPCMQSWHGKYSLFKLTSFSFSPLGREALLSRNAPHLCAMDLDFCRPICAVGARG